MYSSTLKAEDYVEPRCLLCEEPYGASPDIRPVPQERIIRRMNEYLAEIDYAGAEKHLLYWMEEARLGHDLRGQLMLHNELTGHYRKTGEKEKSLEHAEAAVALVHELELEGTISSGTTYVNAATAYNAFGIPDRSMELFEKARAVYEADGRTDKVLLGGLYNNMALNVFALGRYDEALDLYEKALSAMESVEDGRLEQAITYLNIADVYESMLDTKDAEPHIDRCLDTAYRLLTTGEVKDPGYYAFVCGKCAPVFEHYGYFLAAQEMRSHERDGFCKDLV
ncbi:MAG: tetratricopeptide repeat protein [Lachnospiraceae bacterium]|nr:tetratricopeptide repeat protein [Lachnospiraceae bacterium]